MSEKRFVETLQTLLTLVDPNSPESRARVRHILKELFFLARESEKCNGSTIRMIDNAESILNHLIDHRDDFAKEPGARYANKARGEQLRLAISPRC